MKAVFVEGIRDMAESIGLNWLFIPIRKKRLVAAEKSQGNIFLSLSIFLLSTSKETYVCYPRAYIDWYLFMAR